jgi:hypothetical protein
LDADVDVDVVVVVVVVVVVIYSVTLEDVFLKVECVDAMVGWRGRTSRFSLPRQPLAQYEVIRSTAFPRKK